MNEEMKKRVTWLRVFILTGMNQKVQGDWSLQTGSRHPHHSYLDCLCVLWLWSAYRWRWFCYQNSHLLLVGFGPHSSPYSDQGHVSVCTWVTVSMLLPQSLWTVAKFASCLLRADSSFWRIYACLFLERRNMIRLFFALLSHYWL